MSYDLWAWKWAENDVRATPADIAAHTFTVDGYGSSQIPGITEIVTHTEPHPALAAFEPAAVFQILRERLGRHFVLTGDKPSLYGVELYRSEDGEGWRFDFAIDRELVSHLLPIGLGGAFAELGMVVFDAWEQRIVRPGLPKSLSFERGGRLNEVLYEPSWDAVVEAISQMVPGDYAILQNHRGDYVQCAGSMEAMTVECRIWTDRSFHHWVAGSQEENASLAEVAGPGGAMKVRGYEVLSAAEGLKVFERFFRSGKRFGRYRWRDITSTFR